MTGKHLLKKLTSPQKITLYLNGNNPNIYYYFRWKKKSYRGSTGTSDKQTAIDKMNRIYYDITTGSLDKSKEKTIKFEDVVEKFLKHKELEKIAPKTLTEYKRQSKYLLEKFKGHDIESFGSKSVYNDYQEWRNEYYVTHKHKKQQTYKRNGKTVKGRIFNNVGHVTINRECRLIVSILRYAKDYMDLLQNKEIRSYTMLSEKRREEILEKDEYLKLKDYLMKENPYYWKIISFVNNTGIRYPGELNKIRWKDVDLKRSYVIIRDRKSRVKNETLNTAVPLIGDGEKIIKELKQRNNIPLGADDFVFVNDNGRQIKDIRKSFKKSLKECGITKDLTMYSLRHLYTTRMVKRPDIPLKMISATLGHKDTTMIDKHYSHLRTEDVVKSFQRSEDRKQEILMERKKEILREMKKELSELVSEDL